MDAVEEVKGRLAIEDVVAEYVELKRAGRNFRALSPWTAEKTPSLMISPEKGIWHDFSSGKGGNVFSFVMEMEGLDFKGALEMLARKAGVDLDQFRRPGQSRGPNKERLYEANEAAAHFYQVQFSKSQLALEYVFKKRQFDKATALDWRLGYAPNTGDALGKFLLGKNFTQVEIKRAGLSAERYQGTADMFRGRLMVPLADPQGRVVGFTARLLADDPEAPKYINTPATVIYDKSRHVFGLDHAKEAIRKDNFVVLAEGNLDVIASHMAGVKNVVATAGTALTESHLKTLSRFTGDIRLCFDADKAGLAATERAIPIASKVGVNLSIISIPSGKDPDELIHQDADKWREIIQAPAYAVDWLIERYQNLLDVSSAKGKREFSDVILQVVNRLTDSVEKDHYINKIAEIIKVSRESIEQKLTGTKSDNAPVRRRSRVQPETEPRVIAERRKIEQHLLAIVLNRPKLINSAELVSPDMLSEPLRPIWEQLSQPDFDLETTQIGAESQDYVKMLALEFEELYQGLDSRELNQEIIGLQRRLINDYVKAQKTEITNQLETASDIEAQSLLAEAKKLDNLLKRAIGETN